MKQTRDEKVKEKKAMRRKFYDFLAKQRKIEHLSSMLKNRTRPGTHRVVFNFSPTELGLPVKPTQDQISKLGLLRATQRLNRKDFYISYPYLMNEPVNQESFSRHRENVLHQLRVSLHTKPTEIQELPEVNFTSEEL